MQILLLLLIGFGIIKLFGNKYKSDFKSQKCQTAEDKLNERFVNGEIDADTYKKMKETIG